MEQDEGQMEISGYTTPDNGEPLMSNNTTRSVIFHSTGPASVLSIEEHELVEPKADEVRFKVQALGLNRAEIMFREGQYLEQAKLPSRLGYEASGVVDAVGSNVSEFKIGDRVSSIPGFSMSQYGVYGESAVVPASSLAKYPDNLDAIEGASIWMQYLTAYGALISIGQLKAGNSVLITAASSSVGVAAIQIAKMVGAKVIATTRKADKRTFLLETGAEEVIVTDETDLAEEVMRVTDGQGADLIFDPIGGPIVEQLAIAAAPGATLIEYGALSTDPTPFPLFLALGKGLIIRGYTLLEVTLVPDVLAAGKKFVLEGLRNGNLKPVIDKTFSFEEIQAAHEYMASNKQMGKIVVTL
jgi:NADPH:quinone reductase-like Zn-dependent oxidoreductase